MKISKKTKNILFISLALALIIAFIFVWYQSHQANKRRETGIDLRPRPIEELFALDFADVEEGEIKDLGKCNSTRILDELEKSVKNSIYKERWVAYDENFELKILDNCWREFKFGDMRFKIRDLNDSMKVVAIRNWQIELSAEEPEGLKIISLVVRNKKPTPQPKFFNVKMFQTHNFDIYRVGRLDFDRNEFFTYCFDTNSEIGPVDLWSSSKRNSKEIISTIKFK